MPATLKDIAQALGLSLATVSKALADSPEISPETKEKVWAMAQALHYHPNLVARGLRSRRSRTIGVIVDNVSSEFGSLVVAGIQDELLRCGYQMLLISAEKRPEQEKAGLAMLLERAVDGLILADTWHHSVETLPSEVAERNVPVVFVNRRVSIVGVDFVGPDDYYGAYLATEHLIGHGHRRIAHIAGPSGWQATDDRIRGYQCALKDYGLVYDPGLVIHGDWDLPSGYAAAKQLLSRDEPPTAIFVGNDVMAAGVLDAARECGLSLPHDLAIVGYDDREIACFLRPALTTVELPMYDMGLTAAMLLIDRIVRSRAEPVAVAVRGRLVYRASCGPHSLQDEGYAYRRWQARQGRTGSQKGYSGSVPIVEPSLNALQ